MKFLDPVEVLNVGRGYAIGVDGAGNVLVSLTEIFPESDIKQTGKNIHKFFPIDDVKLAERVETLKIKRKW